VTAARARALSLASLLMLAPALGCSAGRDTATRLANAALPAHLPLVRACWEKQFEAAGFSGEFTATVDFTVTEKTSSIRRAKVIKLEATDKHVTQDTTAFVACLQDALNNTTLPTRDDENGPGFATTSDLVVTKYVVAFIDASSKARQEAATRAAHVLVGPRSDRCQGLYTYDPPREQVDLFTAIGQAEAQARSKGDPDQYARTLQKLYDLRLELRDRLKLEVTAIDLPDKNRKRLRAAIEETETKARGIGAAIGCKPP
jgi:hypothetical protein